MTFKLVTNYTPKQKRIIRRRLYDENGMITRDIGFELMFGFDDKSDPNLYNEGLGLEEFCTPKQPNYTIDE